MITIPKERNAIKKMMFSRNPSNSPLKIWPYGVSLNINSAVGEIKIESKEILPKDAPISNIFSSLSVSKDPIDADMPKIIPAIIDKIINKVDSGLIK
jgi:hypothetical protein